VNISTKIWLSISALVLGYLVTVVVNAFSAVHAENRLALTASTLFLATSYSNQAQVAFHSQVQHYQDAVVLGEKDKLGKAGEQAQVVAATLASLLALPGLDGARRDETQDLRNRHRAFTGDAVPVYRVLANGSADDHQGPAAAALDRTTGELNHAFDALVSDCANDLRGELDEAVSRSAQQRLVNLVVFVVVAGVSVFLVALVVTRWTSRLATLMQASERLSRGDFGTTVGNAGSDEIGRLAQSFSFMQDAVRLRSDDLKRFNESLEGTIQVRTKELSDRNAELEHEVAERERAEAELAELHTQLIDASRHAGMAEVATGVLHNVGNVLNSVNVSATLIADQVRSGKEANLAKAAEMMRSHAADLGRFMSEDPRGRQLPDYLARLAEHLATQRQTMLSELKGLGENIEHIKQVVQFQQSYGKSLGVMQVVRPQDVAEEALRLNLGALARHETTVQRQYDELPPMPLDRHRIIQILINLITNAKHALDGVPAVQRTLTLGVTSDGRRLRYIVRDNGVGITPEHLKRVFTHGFTTKPEGHGFGLHSCANAAKEMHGSLSVHSDGAGTGATFVLELPVGGPAP
jgi:signal transduction histidine kinase